jgi:hypothetical protein
MMKSESSIILAALLFVALALYAVFGPRDKEKHIERN